MSALGIADDTRDGTLPMPLRNNGNGTTRRRNRRRRRRNTKNGENDYSSDGNESAKAPKVRRLVGMVPDDSGTESTAFNLTESEYMTSDQASTTRAVRAAREHHRRVQRSMQIETSASENESDDDDDDDSDSADLSECEVPDDSRSAWSRPKADNHGGNASASANEQARRRGGAKVFGLNASAIGIDSGQQTNKCGLTSSVSTAQNNALADMRSTQIRRNVRNIGSVNSGTNSTSSSSSSSASVPSFGEIVIEGEEDRHLLNNCIDMFIDHVRSNPYYRFAVEVALASGHNYDQYYLSNKTRELLKLIDPSTGGDKRSFQRQSTNEMKRDAELLRSAAYFIKSQTRQDEYGLDGKFARDAREGANYLAVQSLQSIRDIHAEHVRMRNALRDARPIVHRRIYLSDKLLAAIGPSMNELYETGLSRDITADDVILHNEHVRSMFAQLVGTKITAIGLKSGTGPAMQAQYLAVGASLQRYADNIVAAMDSGGRRTFAYEYDAPNFYRKRYEHEYGSVPAIAGSSRPAALPMPGRRRSRTIRRLLLHK